MEKIDNSKGQWYFAEIIIRFEPVERDEANNLRRGTTWGNFHLIKAGSPEEAYAKAEKLGKDHNYTYPSHGREIASVFAGVGDLLPIYEDIEDGAEIMYRDYGFISSKKAKRLVSTKEELLGGIKSKRS